MKTKNITLVIASVFLLVFALGLVSADAYFTDTSGVDISSLDAGSSGVDQGQVATFSFKICDGDATDCTNSDADSDSLSAISFNAPLTFTDGTNTFTSGLVSGAPTTLADDASSSTLSLTATVPSNQPAGIYTGTNDLTLDGEEPSGTPFAQDTLTLTITVNDITAPVITLTGSNPEYVALGSTLSDPGASATDETDGTVAVTSDYLSVVNTATAGTYSVTYTAYDSASPTPNTGTATRTVIVYDDFCTSGSSSTNLELSKFDITNNGQGEDDEWLPLDTIEIEVTFDNDRSSSDGTYDLNDVTFELGIFDSTGKDVAGDMIWISKDEEEFEFGDVDEGDDADHTFKFRVNPAEFDANENYKVKVKAYPAGQEATDCVGFSTDMQSFGTSKYSADVQIKMADDENAVVIDTENLPQPATASCEQEVTFTADVWNIGDDDVLGETQILVTLYNSVLGVDQNVTITGDLDQGEKTQATFVFNVPEGMTEKQYDLDMSTHYDYDVDDAEYDEVSEDTFIFPLKVEGNCALPKADVSASLESGGKAGQTLVVKATITNSGTEDTTYTFSVTGYTDWASSAEINNSLTLSAGESKDILVSFEVKKDASGDQTFDIETYSEASLVSTQPVQVAIEPKTGLGLSGSDSAVAILIALISAIAIAIIIVLIVRASKK